MNISRRTFSTLLVGTSIGLDLPVAASTQPKGSNMYDTQDVTFPSGVETLAGKFFSPSGPGPFPAVAIMGPVAFVKEQSPLQYATRLAKQGIAVLIFDPRYHGSSTGEPRRFESPEAKIEDLQSAISFLSNHDRIANDKLGILGICQGVNWAIEASIRDPRVSALALVAGHYLTPETATLYLGDEQVISNRMTRSAAAQKVYDQTGEVQYIPITGSDDALLTAKPVDAWYSPWDNRAPWFGFRGLWENRITAMSEGAIWSWRSDQSIASLKTPVLMVHGDKAASAQ